MVALVLGVAIPILHLLATGSSLPWWQRLLGAVPGVIAMHAWSGYFATRERRLPFLEYGLLQYYIFWGLPTVTYDIAEGEIVSVYAMTEALIGIAIVASLTRLFYPLGCHLGRYLAPTVDRVLPHSAGSGTFLFVPLWIIIAAVFNSGRNEWIPLQVAFIVSTLGSYFPLLAFLYSPHTEMSVTRRNIMIVATTAVLSFSGLFSGMMEAIVYPLFTAGFLMLAVQRTLPWRAGLIALGLMVVIQPVKALYRDAAWRQTENPGIEATINIWATSFSRTWLSDSDFVGNTSQIAARTNELGIIAATFELTPSIVPSDHGTQWKYIATSLIPRVFNTSKASLTEEFNNRFNITFGFQTVEAAESSTASLPLVSDGYWNFGWPGVIFVSSVMGLMLGFITMSIPIASWGGLSIGTALFIHMNACDFFATQFVGRVQVFIMIMCLCWFIRSISAGVARLPINAGLRVAGSK